LKDRQAWSRLARLEEQAAAYQCTPSALFPGSRWGKCRKHGSRPCWCTKSAGRSHRWSSRIRRCLRAEQSAAVSGTHGRHKKSTETRRVEAEEPGRTVAALSRARNIGAGHVSVAATIVGQTLVNICKRTNQQRKPQKPQPPANGKQLDFTNAA
jgi:hypothetical protein